MVFAKLGLVLFVLVLMAEEGRDELPEDAEVLLLLSEEGVESESREDGGG